MLLPCYFRCHDERKKDFIPVSNPPQHADRSPMQQEVYPGDVVGIEVHVRCIPTEPQDVPPAWHRHLQALSLLEFAVVVSSTAFPRTDWSST